MSDNYFQLFVNKFIKIDNTYVTIIVDNLIELIFVEKT